MNTHNWARYLRLCVSARIFAALVFIFTGSIIAFGQQTTGSIVGTVKDQQGAMITTATVKAINVATGLMSQPQNAVFIRLASSAVVPQPQKTSAMRFTMIPRSLA